MDWGSQLRIINQFMFPFLNMNQTWSGFLGRQELLY